MDIERKKEIRDEYGRVVYLEYFKNDEKYRKERQREERKANIWFLIIALFLTAMMLISVIFLIMKG